MLTWVNGGGAPRHRGSRHERRRSSRRAGASRPSRAHQVPPHTSSGTPQYAGWVPRSARPRTFEYGQPAARETWTCSTGLWWMESTCRAKSRSSRIACPRNRRCRSHPVEMAWHTARRRKPPQQVDVPGERPTPTLEQRHREEERAAGNEGAHLVRHAVTSSRQAGYSRPTRAVVTIATCSYWSRLFRTKAIKHQENRGRFTSTLRVSEPDHAPGALAQRPPPPIPRR